ncbi:MAG: acyl-CoA dehydrogenase family protein, partial [Promethearchaeota archaeon]
MSEEYFWFTDEQKQISKEVREFVKENYEEAEKYFWTTKFPWPLVKKVAAKGYFGVGIPKEYGG